MSQRSNDGAALKVAIPAADGYAVQGACVLLGINAKDDQSGNAHLHIHDGIDGETLGTFVLGSDPPNGAHQVTWFGPGGIAMENGIYVDIVSGTPTGAIFYR